MSEPDQTVAGPTGIHDDLSERLWAFDDLTAIRGGPAIDVTAGLVSLGFLKAAIGRRKYTWVSVTLIGLLIGCGLYVKFPPAYHAVTTVLVVDNPGQDPAQEAQADVALATSTTVAQRVVSQLNLPQSVPSFLAAYTVTALTDQVMVINVGAPSASDAQLRAAAVAKQFLAFRAQYTRGQEAQQEAQLNGQVTQAQQRISALDGQISQTSDSAKLASLKDERQAAVDALAQIRQYVTGSLASLRTNSANMAQGSQVLDAPIPIKPSKLKGGPLYIVGGLLGGLVIGLGIVVIGAITSDRLRRRSDIAYTSGAPVRLSVGPLRGSRLPGSGGSAKARARDAKRVVEYLRAVIPGSSRGPAGLAIAAVDDPQTIAPLVTGLAVETASRGAQVIVADLSDGRHLARGFGIDKPGIHPVSSQGKQLLLVVPEEDEILPLGPLRGRSPLTSGQPNERVLAAARSADLILTLVTLDPAFGSDHLATWATDVVAIVTAGRSTAAKINATSQLVRIAGARLDSVVLVGADESDESLGVFAAGL